MNTLPAIKLGDSFLLPITVSDADLVPEDITAWTVRMQGRQGNATSALIHEFLFTKTSPGLGRGEFSAAAADSINWPVGSMLLDIEIITPSGRVHHTETFRLPVGAGVTR
ncbi:hypothetical protein [Phaeovulum sp.]|uniref:hypothetical protein n=1 Tax=Phaeovulum sp. TaxID=2934796 RepID=UPI0039E6325A